MLSAEYAEAAGPATQLWRTDSTHVGGYDADPDEYERWVSERREAVVLLAALADNDRDLLRSTAAGEWVSSATQDLLLAATQEC